jgi:hypothetical protein
LSFRVETPNRLWVADRCWDGLVFFAFVLDAYSRMIVGWQLAAHMRTGLVLDALRMALHRREPGADVELVHHPAGRAKAGVAGVLTPTRGARQHRLILGRPQVAFESGRCGPSGRRFERRRCAVAEIAEERIIRYREYPDRAQIYKPSGLMHLPTGRPRSGVNAGPRPNGRLRRARVRTPPRNRPSNDRRGA